MKKILFIAPPWRGHYTQMIVLANALENRNLNTRFLLSIDALTDNVDTAFERVDWNPEVDTQGTTLFSAAETVWAKVSASTNISDTQKLLVKLLVDLYQPLYQSLSHEISTGTPDLIVVDWTMSAAIDIANKNNIPCIVVSRFVGDFVPSDANYPRFGTSFPAKMNTWQKLVNRFLPVYQLVRYLPLTLTFIKARKQCGHTDDPANAFRNATLIVGTSEVLEHPRPYPDNCHLVGPIYASRNSPLESDLKQWLDHQQQVIYICFGSLARPKKGLIISLIRSLLTTGSSILLVLSELYLNDLNFDQSNIRVEPVVPQVEVLNHDTVKLFVSHCGRNSANEALVAGTPILTIPFFGDQFFNQARLIDAGVAKPIDKQCRDEKAISMAAKYLLLDPLVQRTCREIAKSLDPAAGRVKAIHIIDQYL